MVEQDPDDAVAGWCEYNGPLWYPLGTAEELATHWTSWDPDAMLRPFPSCCPPKAKVDKAFEGAVFPEEEYVQRVKAKYDALRIELLGEREVNPWLESPGSTLDLGIERTWDTGAHNNYEIFYENFVSIADLGGECDSVSWESNLPCELIKDHEGAHRAHISGNTYASWSST